MADEKEDVKDDDKEKATAKKSKLKFIIIAVVVLLIGVGGIYGYSKFNKGKEKKADISQTDKASIVLPLNSFVVNLMDKQGVGKRYLKVTMGLEINKEEDKLLIFFFINLK